MNAAQNLEARLSLHGKPSGTPPAMTIDYGKVPNIFHGSFRIRTDKQTDWQTAVMLLDTQSKKNWMSKHFVENILKTSGDFTPIPEDFGLIGTAIIGEHLECVGSIEVIWRSKTKSGTSVFYVAKDLAASMLMGWEDIVKFDILGSPVLMLVHKKPTKAHKMEQEAKEREHDEKVKEQARKRDEKEKERDAKQRANKKN